MVIPFFKSRRFLRFQSSSQRWMVAYTANEILPEELLFALQLQYCCCNLSLVSVISVQIEVIFLGQHSAMKNSQRIHDIKWKPVELDGLIFKDNADDLIGIEECTDYSLDNTVTGQKVCT